MPTLHWLTRDEDLRTDGTDAAEKRTIGELWEHKSAGQGLFIIAEKSVNGRDIHQQLIEKTGTA